MEPEADVAAENGPGIGAAIRSWVRYEHAPLIILAILAFVWFIMLGRLILLRHHNIATFDFDEGINDQYIWQIAHFRTGNTVRGVPWLGHHAAFAFVLFMPLVWLGGGVQTWDLVQTAALASTAFPLFFLARARIKRPWIACAIGVIWLGQPTVQWFVHEGFHPDNMALPFLVGVFLYGERYRVERRVGEVSARTRWGLWVCFLLAISWKEDLALALVGMGLVWLIRKEWRLALKVTGIAALWFVAFGMVLVPHVAEGSIFSGVYDLGSSPTEIVTNSARHPSRLIDKLDENDAVGYGRDMTEPYGFLPLLSPVTLLIGLPQAFLNIISASAFTWDLKFHYQAIPMTALAISMVEGIRWLWRRERALAEAAVVLALLMALLSSKWYGPMPGSNKYDVGYWPLHPVANIETRRGARAAIPASDGVSADYLMVPQLTHRRTIYTFPNPWRPSNYGVKPGASGDPAKVQWLTVDRGLVNENDSALLASIVASGEFRTVLDRDGVLLLRRVEPPGQGGATIVTG